MSLVRVRLPHRRADGRSRAADAALRRGCLRAMRPVPSHLPGESDFAGAAARFPRRDRDRAHNERGRAVPLHPLRQAVRHQEHDRTRHRQARGQALGLQRPAAAARGAQDVRGLPGDRHDRGFVRPARRARAAEVAHHRGLSARARGARAEEPSPPSVPPPAKGEGEKCHFGFAAFCRNSTSALRSSAEPIFCSGILVPGV